LGLFLEHERVADAFLVARISVQRTEGGLKAAVQVTLLFQRGKRRAETRIVVPGASRSAMASTA
jgi:hypothetical protein